MTDDERSSDPMHEPVRQSLSRLMDGDAAEAEAACAAWARDPNARADWHAYHLIGDVLRSNELARAPAADAAFVARLRQRLADEPVVLAPSSLPAAASVARRTRRGWWAPVAVAAGFVAVAASLVVTRVAAPDAAGERMAQGSSALPGLAAGVTPASSLAASGSSGIDARGEGELLRNADLDRYLAAHRQYGPVSTLSAPGGVVRSVAAAAPGR